MQRLSTSHMYDSSLYHIRMAQDRMFKAQRELTTGKKDNLVVNDPLGAAFVIRANSLKAATAQYQSNLQSATEYLKASESALDESHDLLKQAYSLALQGASSAVDQNGRNAMVVQVGQLQQRLIEMANTQGSSGQYVFSGHQTTTKPFTVAAGVVSYAGDAGTVLVEVSAGETMGVNTDAAQMFTDAYQALENLKNDLASGNIPLLSGQDVDALQKSMDAFKLERGAIGGKLQAVQERTDHNQRRIDDFTKRISDVEEVDMAQAVTDYQLAQTAYEASLQMTASMSKLSLMDFIR